MKLELRESLLFASLTLVYRGARLEIDDIAVLDLANLTIEFSV